MSELVLQLQKEALDSSVQVTDLLRKASVTARKLNITDFYNWCQNELNGYEDLNDIPEYRKVQCELKAYNPYHGFKPCLFQSNKMEDAICKRSINQPISGLEALLSKNESSLSISLTSEELGTLRKLFRCDLEMTLFVSPNVVNSIIDVVRNTVLEWVLKLEEEGIIGENMSFSPEEKEKAKDNPNITIHNFQGVFGNVSNSTISQGLDISVQTGDFKSLADFFKSKCITEEDINELKEAIDNEPKPLAPRSYGEKVGGWIGKMISKAATGAWDISVQVAGTILTKAISSYYGVPYSKDL